MHPFLQSSDDLLHQRGYRLTPQRYMILSVLQEANDHLNIHQIVERVQHRNPCVSLTTVYRTLDLLRDVGLVRENHLSGELSTFEAVDGNGHHHLLCRRCHAVLHFDSALPAHLDEQLQDQYAFHAVTLELAAAGYCDACWKKKEELEDAG